MDQKTQNVQQSRHQPAAVVLANHGLIASGATADEVIDLTRNHVVAGEKFYGPLPLGATTQVDPKPAARTWANRLEKSWRNAGWKGVAQPARYAILQNSEELPAVMGALVPDDVVNGCHDIPEVAEDSDPTECLMGQGRGDRRIVRVRGLGFVLAGPNEKAVAGMEENLLANVLIHTLIARRGQPHRLPNAEIDYLRNMESEKYRQAIAAGSLYQAETKSCRS